MEEIFLVSIQNFPFFAVTGNITTCYYIEEHGDLNANVDPNDYENTEYQFLIKWKDWAHIHNTWESEHTLKEQKVKGIKKLDNYMKKEAEIQKWISYSTPEDVEYYECQLELSQELLKSYNEVERIIGKVFHFLNRLSVLTVYFYFSQVQ